LGGWDSCTPAGERHLVSIGYSSHGGGGEMIPGTVSKMTQSTVASAATIIVKTDIVLLTGATQVNTINPGLGAGQSQFLVLIPVTGSVILGTSGNILVGLTAVVNRALYLVWVKSLGKWVINSGV